MEYSARQYGRIGDTIFLEIHPEVLKIPGVMYTSDVSNKSGVIPITIEAAKDKIDFGATAKCEVLVPKLIPLNLIRNMPNG
jgi:hypothetical protein